MLGIGVPQVNAREFARGSDPAAGATAYCVKSCKATSSPALTVAIRQQQVLYTLCYSRGIATTALRHAALSRCFRRKPHWYRGGNLRGAASLRQSGSLLNARFQRRRNEYEALCPVFSS